MQAAVGDGAVEQVGELAGAPVGAVQEDGAA